MSEKGRNTFVLSDEMRDYFYKIGVKSSNESGNSRSGVFPTNIHPFYLCMIMGIRSSKLGTSHLWLDLLPSLPSSWLGQG